MTIVQRQLQNGVLNNMYVILSHNLDVISVILQMQENVGYVGKNHNVDVIFSHNVDAFSHNVDVFSHNVIMTEYEISCRCHYDSHKVNIIFSHYVDIMFSHNVDVLQKKMSGVLSRGKNP